MSMTLIHYQCFGGSSFFTTISPIEMNSPLGMRLAMPDREDEKTNNSAMYDFGESLQTAKERVALMNKNPGVGARIYNMITTTFVEILCGKQ